MASNNYTSSNVVPSSDTFREWVDLTNRITYDMEKVVVTTLTSNVGGGTIGNAYVNGFFLSNTTLVSNNLSGAGGANATHFGTKTPTANLNITSNTVQSGNLFATANITHSGEAFVASSNLHINSTSSNTSVNSTMFHISGTTLDVNSNVDIDSATVTVDGGSLTVGSNTILNANAVSYTHLTLPTNREV